MKKLSLVFSSLILVLVLVGCAPQNNANAVASETLELPTVSGEDGKEEVQLPEISDQDFEHTIGGLCEYLEKTYAVTGEKTQMSYDVIDAQDGYRYLFKYNKSPVQVEVYSFDPDKLTDAARENIENVKANGKLKVIDRELEAYIGGSGEYIMLYQDASKDEANAAQKERVVKLFEGFQTTASK